jgi:hypothetical protein
MNQLNIMKKAFGPEKNLHFLRSGPASCRYTYASFPTAVKV